MKIKEVIEEGKNALSKNNIEDNVIITREPVSYTHLTLPTILRV